MSAASVPPLPPVLVPYDDEDDESTAVTQLVEALRESLRSATESCERVTQVARRRSSQPRMKGKGNE